MSPWCLPLGKAENEGRATYQACRAQIGSISVTMTTQPIPFKAWAQPFPTCNRKRHQLKTGKEETESRDERTKNSFDKKLHSFGFD